MKKLFILFLTIVFLASCSGDKKSVDAIIDSGDLSAVKAKRTEINQQQRDLKSDLDKLNEYIDSHDITLKYKAMLKPIRT